MRDKKAPVIPSQRESVLLAILLHGEIYGREIRRKFTERTGADLPLGSLYVTLDRMEEKGFVKSRMGDPDPERGGNRRKFYRLTAVGTSAQNRMREWMQPNAGVTSHA